MLRGGKHVKPATVLQMPMPPTRRDDPVPIQASFSRHDPTCWHHGPNLAPYVAVTVIYCPGPWRRVGANFRPLEECVVTLGGHGGRVFRVASDVGGTVIGLPLPLTVTPEGGAACR